MNKTILVIEDDLELRENIVKILNLLAFNVIEASDGLAGLDLIKTKEIDLVISDIKMPNKDGYELLEEVKKIPEKNSIPFIFLTGNIEREQIRKGMNIGADDYITKPFNAEDLMASIKTRFEKNKNLSDHFSNKFKTLEKDIKNKLNKNLLTGLPNLDSFNNYITQIKETQNSGLIYILYNFEIDGDFELLNFLSISSINNLRSDIILKMKKIISSKDNFYQFNELDFAILSEINSMEYNITDIENYANTIMNLIKEPYIIDEIEINISISIGIAAANTENQKFDDLYKNANLTKLYVKKNKGDNYKFYNEKIKELMNRDFLVDLKDHIEIKSTKNPSKKRSIDKSLQENIPFETKIFFLYPQNLLQNQFIKEIVKNEYAAYILKDHIKARQLLKMYPRSVIFINIDVGLTDKEWSDYIKDIQVSPDYIEIKIGILSHYDDEKKEELYLMKLLVHCGYIKLKAGFDESLKILLNVLEAIEVKGKRKYVRVNCDNKSNVTCNLRINGELYNGIIKDISSTGMAFYFLKTIDLNLKNGMEINDIQLSLKGIICHLSGKISGIRETEHISIYVILFNYKNYEERNKIHDFIYRALQEDIDLEIAKI